MATLQKCRLPYTEATLQEIQRLGVAAPITIPHVAEEDTICQGYDIPKVCVSLESFFVY
jgi:cytochrome P450